jgi:hypothetical protein
LIVLGMLIGALIFAAGYAVAIYLPRPKADPWKDYRDDRGLLSRRKVGEVSGRKEKARSS